MVKKSKLPAKLMDRYDLTNLFVEDLPNFWRLLYTISRHNEERYIVIVEIVDHREYDKLFGLM